MVDAICDKLSQDGTLVTLRCAMLAYLRKPMLFQAAT